MRYNKIIGDDTLARLSDQLWPYGYRTRILDKTNNGLMYCQPITEKLW